MWHLMELYNLLLIRHKMKRIGVGQLIVIWDLEQVNHKMTTQLPSITPKFFLGVMLLHLIFSVPFIHFIISHSIEYNKRNSCTKNFETKKKKK